MRLVKLKHFSSTCLRKGSNQLIRKKTYQSYPDEIRKLAPQVDYGYIKGCVFFWTIGHLYLASDVYRHGMDNCNFLQSLTILVVSAAWPITLPATVLCGTGPALLMTVNYIRKK